MEMEKTSDYYEEFKNYLKHSNDTRATVEELKKNFLGFLKRVQTIH